MLAFRNQFDKFTSLEEVFDQAIKKGYSSKEEYLNQGFKGDEDRAKAFFARYQDALTRLSKKDTDELLNGGQPSGLSAWAPTSWGQAADNAHDALGWAGSHKLASVGIVIAADAAHHALGWIAKQTPKPFSVIPRLGQIATYPARAPELAAGIAWRSYANRYDDRDWANSTTARTLENYKVLDGKYRALHFATQIGPEAEVGTFLESVLHKTKGQTDKGEELWRTFEGSLVDSYIKGGWDRNWGKIYSETDQMLHGASPLWRGIWHGPLLSKEARPEARDILKKAHEIAANPSLAKSLSPKDFVLREMENLEKKILEGTPIDDYRKATTALLNKLRNVATSR